MFVIPATWEVEIWRIVVLRQLRKVSEIPISTNKSEMVLHAYNPSFTGRTGRKIMVQANCGPKKTKKKRKVRPHLKNN
jgi:hypothetical protein